MKTHSFVVSYTGKFGVTHRLESNSPIRLIHAINNCFADTDQIIVMQNDVVRQANLNASSEAVERVMFNVKLWREEVMES